MVTLLCTLEQGSTSIILHLAVNLIMSRHLPSFSAALQESPYLSHNNEVRLTQQMAGAEQEPRGMASNTVRLEAREITQDDPSSLHPPCFTLLDTLFL